MTSRLVTWFDATSSTLPPGLSGYITTFGEILQLEQKSDGQQNIQAGFVRLVEKSQTDLSLIRKWINFCEENHGPTAEDR